MTRIGLWLTAIVMLGLSWPASPWSRWWLVELAGAFYLWFAGVTLVLLIALGWGRSPWGLFRRGHRIIGHC